MRAGTPTLPSRVLSAAVAALDNPFFPLSSPSSSTLCFAMSTSEGTTLASPSSPSHWTACRRVCGSRASSRTSASSGAITGASSASTAGSRRRSLPDADSSRGTSAKKNDDASSGETAPASVTVPSAVGHAPPTCVCICVTCPSDTDKLTLSGPGIQRASFHFPIDWKLRANSAFLKPTTSRPLPHTPGRPSNCTRTTPFGARATLVASVPCACIDAVLPSSAAATATNDVLRMRLTVW